MSCGRDWNYASQNLLSYVAKQQTLVVIKENEHIVSAARA